MKVKIAQLDVVCNDLEYNFNQIKTLVEQAKAENVDLIIFSEMCVSGYILNDLYLNNDFCEEVIKYNQKINDLSDGIGIIYGSLAYNKNIKGRDGCYARHNAAYFYYNNENMLDNIGGYYVKKLNPDYRYFDDSRYFLSGLEISQDAATVEFKGKKLGIQICEDMWDENYLNKVNEQYQGCDMLINLSASPYVVNKEQERLNQARKIVDKYQIENFIYVNCVGMQNNGKNVLMFDGNSFVVNKAGIVLELNDDFEAEDKNIDLFNENLEVIQHSNNNQKLYHCLVKAIKKFDETIFNKRFNWIIGLSGGLDSTVNACLLVKALGNERVKAYNMASSYNSETTKGIANQLAKDLNIELRNGSIEKITKASCETLNDYNYNVEIPSLTYENIQARIRGHLLGSFASLENGVICNNANKIEIALGYCTLYGDSIGAMSPIGDLTKVELFDLAKQINKDFNKEVVPSALLPQVDENNVKWDMPPSAELKDNQFDPMKWFYHDEIIKHIIENPQENITSILKAYLDGSLMKSKLGKWINYYGLDDPIKFIDDIKWLLRTMQLAYFKRIQMPPIVTISNRGFGYDYRESQLPLRYTSTFDELVENILQMKSI